MVLFFISDGEDWHRQRVALQTVAINGKIIGQYLADQDQVRVCRLITQPSLNARSTIIMWHCHISSCLKLKFIGFILKSKVRH